MQYDHIFDSSTAFYGKKYTLDTDHQRPTIVFFEKEGVVLSADANGNAVFSNTDGDILYRGKADGPNPFFDRIHCSVVGCTVHVLFPIVKWIDNYPHCDGEHDRWDEIIVGEIPVIYPAEESQQRSSI